MDDIKKSLFRYWQLIPNFFITHLQSLYDVKPKAQSERFAPFYYAIANYCTRWLCNFKGLSKDGGQADFSKNPL
jgi:hypothetical protein